MKVSRYNLYFPLEDRYVIYNTLTDSIMVADEELMLTASSLEGIDTSSIQSLLQCGIVVSDNTDEKAILRYRYYAAKYAADFISVLLLPTYACNLSCHYCPNPAHPVFMTPETTESVILFLKSLMKSTRCGVVLKLYGGEPLLNELCCRSLCETLSSFCRERNLPFLAAAMTNGTLLAHTKTEKLLTCLGAVHVTLDGFKPYHDSIRFYTDGGGTYEDIMKGLSLAREKAMRISVRVNTTSENLDSIRELLEDLKKRKFDEYEGFEIYFGPIAPKDECKHFKDDVSSQKFKDSTFALVSQVREIVKASAWKGKTRDIISDVRSVSKPELCQYQKAHTFVIGPHGKFYTCPAFAGDPDYCIGTLKDGTAEFTSLYYDMHTRDVMQLECADCEYMPVCGGGCPAAAYSQHKTVDSYYCGTTRESTESQMLSYLQYKYPDLFRR
jgi:uncharacterized protein